MGEGRKAAGVDLLQILQSLDGIDEIHLLVGDRSDWDLFSDFSPRSISTSQAVFKFGNELLRFIDAEDPSTLLYFGAGSAPLLSGKTIEESLSEVVHSSSPLGIVNNVHSTDWAILNHPALIGEFINRLPSDNQLGWVMKNEIGFRVAGLLTSAATRMDIDTPTDLIILGSHPEVGPATKAYLKTHAIEANERLSLISDLLKQSAVTLTIIGRASSDVLQQLDKQTQIWIRAFVEERGMVASGRLANGEVRSLVAEYLDYAGYAAAIEFLSSISDGVLWDTRVWMGHKSEWPSIGDRFASDLGWVDEIKDDRLRLFTEHVVGAPIPIATGGHGTVSGGVLALLDSLRLE